VGAVILASLGVAAAAGASAAAVLLPPGRPRVLAMLLALTLFPILILGDQWNSAQIADLRDEPAGLIALALVVTAAVVVAIAAIFRRRPILLPLAIVAALPFRVPLEAGGDTANLLVPLYLVIAAGVVWVAARDIGLWPAGPVAGEGASGLTRPETPSPTPPAGVAVWLPRVLAAVVVLYAAQALYSPDFSKSLQNVCFFFVPFSLVFALLRDVEWDKKLLALVLWVVAVEAVAFVVVGSVEWVTGSLFWNDQVIRSNEFHTYFRVNSVFWDPNIYGRYLALAIVIAMSALLWIKDRRTFALLTALVGVLWFGLVPTFSQSSFVALLGGLAVLAAIRWSWKWTLAAVAAGAVLGIVIVIFAGGVSKLSPDRLNVDTGGRTNLISGGIELFAQRPIWGYGAGGFPRAYREHVDTGNNPLSVSHTEPITVAAEQGLLGLVSYAALLLTAVWTMGTGLFASRAGGVDGGVSGRVRPDAPPAATGPAAERPVPESSASPTRAIGAPIGRVSPSAARISLNVPATSDS
jgi:putative inorganic carbon (HCO3(-)) transporter